MELIKYPKIQTLFKRNEKGRIIVDEYSKLEFESVDQWFVTEKIDGTNIRIAFDKKLNKVEILGRTEKSELHVDLTKALYRLINKKLLNEVFDDDVILFGEGIGEKIQAGKYGKKYKFYLFDVYYKFKFLNNEELENVATKLNLNIVSSLGIFTKQEIKNLIMTCFYSKINKEVLAEGVVAKSYPLLFNEKGERVMFKLKCSDYRKIMEKPIGWNIDL